MSNTTQEEVRDLVAHLFRHKAGQIVSILTSIFGFENLDLAEDVVQETLVKALQQWPFSGVPANPSGWILQAAKNQALDVLRRQSRFREKEPEITRQLEQQLRPASDLHSIQFEDEQLTLMFACCHPAIPREIQVALILKTLCGFNIREIGRAFLSQEATIAQRLVRAKRKIRENRIRLELPDENEMPSRLQSVLQVLYLLFNEGYSASAGEDLIRQDLCEEALRLGELLSEHRVGNLPETRALLALMFFQACRFHTRMNPEGNLLLLAEQDRSKWDQQMIQRGYYHLDRASSPKLTEFHLQASIAATHASALSADSTDWSAILSFYDALLILDSSPIVKLNRAVALSMVRGAEAGIEELKKLQDDPVVKSYYLLYATLAEMHFRAGRISKALEYYEQTLSLAHTEPEKKFVQGRITACRKGVQKIED